MSEYLTRADRMKQPAALDVARAVAEEHGVCVRPLAKERIDLDTGRVDIVPVPCGSTVASVCPTCAEKNRRLRMAQCREGWHLTEEPDFTPDAPSDDQRALTAYRADLVKAYRQA
ncbi:replication initiator protein, partial [Saccharothrix sp. MB29]|nr:replication initiator protein [Saccharothrix sp. MB29]